MLSNNFITGNYAIFSASIFFTILNIYYLPIMRGLDIKADVDVEYINGWRPRTTLQGDPQGQ